jgi:DNA polymerase
VFEAANASLDSAWRADWLVVGNPPDEHDEREGVPVFGESGAGARLLNNMLKAVGAYRRGAAPGGAATLPAQTAFVTQVTKCRPDPTRNPTPQELATCAHFLRREVALVQPKVILAMGPFAAQTLLQGQLPAGSKIPHGQLRGKVYQFQGIPVIVTYNPDNLVRNPIDKGRAWADLCLAMQTLERAL